MILIFSLALLGLLDAGYLLYKKQWTKKLVCLLGDDCDAVVKSQYGYLLFGTPNELWGILYYLTIIIGSLSGLIPLIFLQVLATASIIASAVLTGIQAFILKKWCEFCLASIVINAAIFILIFYL